ncbi:MAG: TonB-dependent receptor domain-containing protein, partial [Enterovibrio sp.]
KTVPSLEISQSGSRGQLASIFMRGTNSNHVLVLVDGVRLPRSMLGTVDFNMLPLNAVERIEVIRGSGATIYGSDAVGGVINIITRSDEPSAFVAAGAGSMASSQASAGITTALSDFVTMQLQGGYDKTDGYNVQPHVAPLDDLHGFKGKNMSLRFALTPRENWRANLSGNWYQNQIGYANFDGQKKNGWVQNRNLSADVSWQQGRWNTLARVDKSWQENYDYFATQPRDESALTSKISQLFASMASRYDYSETLSVTAGSDFLQEEYLRGSLLDSAAIDDNPRKNLGTFVLAHWQFVPQAQLETSVRYDRNQQYGGNFSQQVAMGWELLDAYQVRASYGNAFKAPSFDKLYGFGGNSRLDPEESQQVELGVDGATAGVSWRVNGYFNKIDNLIMSVNSASGWVNKNIDKAQITGLELEADFSLGGLANQMSLELRDPKDLNTNEQLARRAKTVAKWQSSYQIGDVTLGAQYAYQGKRPDYAGGPILLSHSVWDVSASYAASAHVTLQGKVSNLFDKRYETAGTYPAEARAVYANVQLTF